MKKILIDASDENNVQIAITENKRLVNFVLGDSENSIGDIYVGRVDHVEYSLQAYFVDYGANKNGFLSFTSTNLTLSKNDYVVVQIVKDEKSNKGAVLTTFIEIKTLFMIALTNKDSLCAVSKKITSRYERDKLKEYYKQFQSDIAKENNFAAISHNDNKNAKSKNNYFNASNLNIIFRHSAMGQDYSKLKKDFDNICKKIETIQKSFKKKVKLIMQSPSVSEKIVVDHYKPDTEVYIQGKIPQSISNYVQKHDSKLNIFVKHDIHEQIESILHERVNLPSGGYIIIQHTEALTSIDVNSGVCKKDNSIDKTVFTTNLEAAPEIAHQLQLRDIGGLIVVDFIDMYQQEYIEHVMNAIKINMESDKAKYNIGKIDQFGLLSISRQQLRKNIFYSTHKKCNSCEGKGYSHKDPVAAFLLMMKLENLLHDDHKNIDAVTVQCNADLVYYIVNNLNSLSKIEKKYSKKIKFEFHDATKITYIRDGELHTIDDITENINAGKFIMPEIVQATPSNDVHAEIICENNEKSADAILSKQINTNSIKYIKSEKQNLLENRRVSQYFNPEKVILQSDFVFIGTELVGKV